MSGSKELMSDFSKIILVALVFGAIAGIFLVTSEVTKHVIGFWIVLAAIIAGVPDIEVRIS